MSNKSLRVGVFYWPSGNLVLHCAVKSRTLHPTSTCPRPGLGSEMLDALISYAEINYQLIPFDHDMTGFEHLNFTTTSDIFTTGFVALILQGIVDTIVPSFLIINERLNYMDVSYPMIYFNPVFVVRRAQPDLMSMAGTTFAVFDDGLWLMGLCTLVILISLLLSIGKCFYTKSYTTPDLWTYIKFCIGRGFEGEENCKANNFLFIILALFIVLYTGLYQKALLAHLLVDNNQNPFNDIDQLIDRVSEKKLTIIIPYDRYWFAEEIQHSNNSFYRQFSHAIQQNPIRIEGNLHERMKLLETGNYVYVDHETSAKLDIQKHCNLTYVRAYELPSYWGSYGFRKGTEWPKKFNDATSLARRRQEAITMKYGVTVDACKRMEHQVQVHALSMPSLSGVFLLLGAGFAVATLLFLCELIRRRKGR